MSIAPSHPEYRLEQQEYREPEPEPVAREVRIEYLREQLAQLAATPDLLHASDVACPLCATALDVCRSRRKGTFFLFHRVADCEHSERFWHTDCEDRDAAVAAWREKQNEETNL